MIKLFQFGNVKLVIGIVLLLIPLLIFSMAWITGGCGESLPPSCPNEIVELLQYNFLFRWVNIVVFLLALIFVIIQVVDKVRNQ